MKVEKIRDNDRPENPNKRICTRIIRLHSALSANPVAFTIGRQILRSGTSVGANYREVCRSRSDAEFIAKIGDCLKELDEILYWLELLVEASIFSPEILSNLMGETDELLAILTTISKNRQKTLKTRNPPNA